MIIREELEKNEALTLSQYACLSTNSKGRQKEEENSDIRTCFQRDRDRILHSLAFRRLKHKTQVFLSPRGDHYRTRMTHSLEVSQISRTIGKALRLNEDLIEAIALGHDLGHTPYGHAGERVLNNICPLGFSHNKQSIRVVDCIEKNFKGLNLTFEVRDGILNHKTSTKPSTLEGQVVRLSDKIAYLHHDTEDAIRAGILLEDDIPEEYKRTLGTSSKKRLNTIIHDIIYNSIDKPEIKMSREIEESMMRLREYMFYNVYTNELAKKEEHKTDRLISSLYEYYLENPNQMTDIYVQNIDKYGKEQIVCDYIAGMTDSYAVNRFMEINVPSGWKKD